MLMFYSCVYKNSVLFALPAGITNIRMSGIWVGQGGGSDGLVFVKRGGEAAAAAALHNPRRGNDLDGMWVKTEMTDNAR